MSNNLIEIQKEVTELLINNVEKEKIIKEEKADGINGVILYSNFYISNAIYDQKEKFITVEVYRGIFTDTFNKMVQRYPVNHSADKLNDVISKIVASTIKILEEVFDGTSNWNGYLESEETMKSLPTHEAKGLVKFSLTCIVNFDLLEIDSSHVNDIYSPSTDVRLLVLDKESKSFIPHE